MRELSPKEAYITLMRNLITARGERDTLPDEKEDAFADALDRRRAEMSAEEAREVEVELSHLLSGLHISDEDCDYAERVSILGSWSGKHNTIALAKRALAEGIPGDFAECGVHSGGHPALMGYVLRRYGGAADAGRRVHLFDSFEGHPMAGLKDEPAYQKQLGINPDPSVGRPSGIFLATIEQCRENMRNWGAPEDRLTYHVGWLQEVLPKIARDFPPLALLRVDVDLHDSTVPVFEYLYDKVSPGGFIISDDWGETDGYDACRQATYDFFDRRGIPRPEVTRLPVTPGTVWWRKA